MQKADERRPPDIGIPQRESGDGQADEGGQEEQVLHPLHQTMLDLGMMVAEASASTDPSSRIRMSAAPTVGDLGEVTFDVVDLGDDAVEGRPERPVGEGFLGLAQSDPGPFQREAGLVDGGLGIDVSLAQLPGALEAYLRIGHLYPGEIERQFGGTNRRRPAIDATASKASLRAPDACP